MMSKRNYESFARILGRSRDLNDAVTHIVLYLAFDNPNFDESKFRAAIEAERARTSA